MSKLFTVGVALLLATNAVQASDEDVRDLQKRVLDYKDIRCNLIIESRHWNTNISGKPIPISIV